MIHINGHGGRIVARLDKMTLMMDYNPAQNNCTREHVSRSVLLPLLIMVCCMEYFMKQMVSLGSSISDKKTGAVKK